MQIKGKAWKFGDDINTDLIIAGKFKLSITDIDELSRHAMEGAMLNFAQKVKKDDFVVAGKNFGCGSSREQAPVVLKHLEVGAVVAESFARIFYRNAINIGLPALECKDARDIQEGDILELALSQGKLKNITENKSYSVAPVPDELWAILDEGGLVSYVKKHGRLPWQE